MHISAEFESVQFCRRAREFLLDSQDSEPDDVSDDERLLLLFADLTPTSSYEDLVDAAEKFLRNA